MFSFMANTLGHFYKNFQGFTYCSVFKVLCCRLSDSSFTISQLRSLVNNFFKFFSNLSCCLKGRSLFGSFVPVVQGQGISYYLFLQKSTPFLQSFLNCFNCIYNSSKSHDALCIITIRYTPQRQNEYPPYISSTHLITKKEPALMIILTLKRQQYIKVRLFPVEKISPIEGISS